MEVETSKNGKGGAPIANKNALSHGFYAAKHALNLRSFDELDRRKRVVREIVATRDDLLAELGGADNATVQERIIVENIARDVALRDTVDAYVFSLVSPLRGRGKTKTVVPIIRERDLIIKRIQAGLALLGLERREKRVQSLSEYIEQTYGQKAANESEES